MPWPEDDPIFKWELNKKVLYGPDGPHPLTRMVFDLFIIDLGQAYFFTDFMVIPWIIKFICKLFGIDLGLDE